MSKKFSQFISIKRMERLKRFHLCMKFVVCYILLMIYLFHSLYLCLFLMHTKYVLHAQWRTGFSFFHHNFHFTRRIHKGYFVCTRNIIPNLQFYSIEIHACTLFYAIASLIGWMYHAVNVTGCTTNIETSIYISRTHSIWLTD